MVLRDKCPSQWGQLKQSLRLDLPQVSRVPGAAVARGGGGQKCQRLACGLQASGRTWAFPLRQRKAAEDLEQVTTPRALAGY